MKKLGFYFPGTARRNDLPFKSGNVGVIGDDLDLPFVCLAKAFEKNGVECHTVDALPLAEFDGFVFNDMPDRANEVLRFAKANGVPAFLFVDENHFIAPRNAAFDRYAEFSTVFSYNDEAVSLGFARKFNYGNTLHVPPSPGMPFESRKLATMISSRVKKNRRHCCSYLRLQTILMFERRHLDDFDLWGIGWDKGVNFLQEHPLPYSAISALHLHRLLPRRRLRCWRGAVTRKRDVLPRYRFAYCYENTTEIPGYVTEKIFDVLMAGTVPVYLAHPSVADSIPRACFVDRADFRSDEDLYRFLKGMDEARWQVYADAGVEFLTSQAAQDFSISERVNRVLDGILPVIGAGVSRPALSQGENAKADRGCK